MTDLVPMTWSHTGTPATVDDVLRHVGPGWHALVRQLLLDLSAAGWDGQLVQVKEKFGGLRFYIGAEADALHTIISGAESRSFRACDECGAPGTMSTSGWCKVRCAIHA